MTLTERGAGEAIGSGKCRDAEKSVLLMRMLMTRMMVFAQYVEEKMTCETAKGMHENAETITQLMLRTNA
jgi:hypothetical protein